MSKILFISLMIVSTNIYANSFVENLTNELLVINSVRVSPYKTDIDEIKNAEASLVEYRTFLEGLKKSLGNEKLNCKVEPQVYVKAENWNWLATSYFGADIDYDLNWMSSLQDWQEITVGSSSYDMAAKELKKACDFEKNNQHIFDYFKKSNIIINPASFGFLKLPSLDNQISFISNLYVELIKLGYTPKLSNASKTSELIIISIEVENVSSKDLQFNRWGADLYEIDNGDYISIVAGHKSYKELAEVLVKYHLK